MLQVVELFVKLFVIFFYVIWPRPQHHRATTIIISKPYLTSTYCINPTWRQPREHANYLDHTTEHFCMEARQQSRRALILNPRLLWSRYDERHHPRTIIVYHCFVYLTVLFIQPVSNSPSDQFPIIFTYHSRLWLHCHCDSIPTDDVTDFTNDEP